MPVSSPSPPWPGWRHGGGPVAVSGQLRARNAPGEGETQPAAPRGRALRRIRPDPGALPPRRAAPPRARPLPRGESPGQSPSIPSISTDPRTRTGGATRIEGQDMLGFRVPARRTVHPGPATGRRASAPCWAGTFHPAGVELRPHGPRVSTTSVPAQGSPSHAPWAKPCSCTETRLVRRGPGPAGDPGRPPARCRPGRFPHRGGVSVRRFLPAVPSLGASYTLESGASFNLEHYFRRQTATPPASGTRSPA